RHRTGARARTRRRARARARGRSARAGADGVLGGTVAVTEEAHAADTGQHPEQALTHPVTSTGLSNEKIAMWAFLGSECLLFGALISTYLLYRGRSVVGPFPHQVYDIPYTSVSSFVLLMSSLTMVLALA